ncbi:MAG: hypothetical protein ACRDQZ_13200 [Mycobacteriales bacterium]
MTAGALDLDVTEAEQRREAQRRIEADAAKRFREVYGTIGARAVRDYVRSVLIPPAIIRLYHIGMGIEQFDVPTGFGNVIHVPAFASVQVDALSKLIDLGVPRQLGLIDSTGDELPGVMALGTLDLEEVQAQQGQRFLAAGNGHPSNGGAQVSPADPSRPEIHENGDVMLSPSVRHGDYEIVEVEQDAMAPRDGERPGEIPPPPVKPELTLAQDILARRRALRRSRPQSSDETP